MNGGQTAQRLVEPASLRWKQGIHDYLESQRRGGREGDLQDTKSIR